MGTLTLSQKRLPFVLSGIEATGRTLEFDGGDEFCFRRTRSCHLNLKKNGLCHRISAKVSVGRANLDAQTQISTKVLFNVQYVEGVFFQAPLCTPVQDSLKRAIR
jgi:hypothetical protein